MNKVYVFLADGFEEIEGLTVVDLLRRAGIETITVSVMGREKVIGSHRIPVTADTLIGEVHPTKEDMLVLPGGMPGTLHLGDCEGLKCFLMKAAGSRKAWLIKWKKSHLLPGHGRRTYRCGSDCGTRCDRRKYHDIQRSWNRHSFCSPPHRGALRKRDGGQNR